MSTHGDARKRHHPERIKRVGLVVAPLLAVLAYATIPALVLDDSGATIRGLSHSGRAVAATGVLMAVLWVTEAIPVAVTALLPILLFPLLSGGAISAGAAASPYAHELIFLFLGGFLVALAMQRWTLDQRIALHTIRIVGTRPKRLVAGFMLATAVLSMWVSNTATVVMMMPIALSVIEVARRRARSADGETNDDIDRFAASLLLATAYAGSIGGIATLIGTPPNLLLAAFLRSDLGITINFARWLAIGVPFSAIFLPIAWWLLTTHLFPVRLATVIDGDSFVDEQLRTRGAASREERMVLLVFGLAAIAWVSGPWLRALTVAGVQPLGGLSDTGIAVAAALALFVLPAARDPASPASAAPRLLDWSDTRNVPWGLLLLFGGGLSLASAVRSTGVAEFIGRGVAGLGQLPSPLTITAVVTLVVFLTELTSNTATTATLLPILAAVAPGLGLDPIQLVVPAAIAASCAFMMPVATPPNAIVFGTGHVTMQQMMRAGLWLNLVAIVLLVPLAYVVPILLRTSSP